MSTTDNNLQVINSMTEDQLTSLKNSEGKIPSLANQLIMTEGVEATVDNTVSLPIGSIFPSAIPQTDSRFHLLDGTTISTTGIYADFVTLLKNLVTAGYSITCTQTEFDNDVNNTGNCGKFVIDETAGTVRLPKITKFIQGLDSITNIGKSLEAGLPNITGSFANWGEGYSEGNYAYGHATGAFYEIDAAHYGWGTATGKDEDNADIGIDASRSSPVYGKSDTVQPQSTQYPYYIVLATGYKSSQSVNTDEIMKEVNLKSPDIEYLSEAEKKKWFLLTHPVNSIYITDEEESPVDKYGGGWSRIDAGYALWTASSGAGGTIEESLPNIKGSISMGSMLRYGNSQGAPSASPAFSYTGSTSRNSKAGGGGSNHSEWSMSYSFSASNYDDTYKEHSGVQPPARKVYAWKRIS